MPNPQDAEVIVVGAGPSGSFTAAALARKGHRVLLLDRRAFPRDKVCGDAVSRDVVTMMFDLGMRDKVEAAEARGEFYPLESIRLVSPRMHAMEVPFLPAENGAKSYVAPRIYYDAVVQQHALDCGAEFVVGEVKEPLIENGRVTGVKAQLNGHVQMLRANVVVGADGVTSAVMRHLRPPEKQHKDSHRAVALRAYIEDMELYPHEVEFFLYEEILPGYAWVFPAGENTANIGLGMRLDQFRSTKGNLRKMLQDFLAIPAIRERLRQGGVVRDVATWQLNFGSQRNLQHAFDGALLVGDAAGFINPLTGGGIHNGLVSAILAADAIDEALRHGDVSRSALQRYETMCRAEMGAQMRKAYFFQRLLHYVPSVADLLFLRAQRYHGLADIFISKL
jgi:geranylgeranyl reductase family protein